MVRTIEIVILIGSIILTPIAIIYANKARGYHALGGEYLIPIVGLLIVIIIEEIYKESEERRPRIKHEKSKRCPKCRKKLGKFSSLSRRDGKTEVCANCAYKEAMKDAEKMIQRFKEESK